MNILFKAATSLSAMTVSLLAFGTSVTDTTLKSSDLIGAHVENQSGEAIGRVEDLAVDLRSGKVVHVIVGSGGVVSLGQRYVAIPPDNFNFERSNKKLRIDISKEKLKTAPTLEMSKWSAFYQGGQAEEANRFFADGAASTAGRDKAKPSQTAEDVTGSATSVLQASKLIGSPVKNREDEKVGSAEDLVVDLSNRRVLAVIVSTGGFLGMGNSLSAIPPSKFNLNTEKSQLQLDVTKEALQNAPHFTAREWPDFSQSNYMAGVYRAYNLEPSSIETDNRSLADANNTGRNTRDRQFHTLTPVDQSNNPRDLQITQQIRKAVVDTKDLSVNAQNVKIITVDGRVTLRGPVNTPAEKQIISEIATRIAQRGNVDDQLEVLTRDASQR